MNQKSLLPGLTLSIFIFCVTFFLPLHAVSQNIVNVNNLTGTAGAAIPIYNVSVGDLSASVSLAYNATGIKVEDYDYSCGLGWRLVANASVRREVRGFPDDIEYQGNSSYAVIKGWMRSGNSARQTIQSLTFNPVNSSNSCADEIANATAIANNLTYNYDTEPDNFSVSAPGLSCSFVFDASSNPVIKISPYRDYVINYTTDANGKITAFTITNENGIKYFFDKPNSVEHSIDLLIPGVIPASNNPTALEAFKREYLQYRADFDYSGNPTGTRVNYHDEWGLTKIEDTKGNTITYNYENYSIQNPEIYRRTTHTDIEILTPDGSGNFIKKKIYGVTKAKVNLRLLSISTMQIGYDLGEMPVIEFTWLNQSEMPGDPMEEKKLRMITLLREKKVYELIYSEKFMTNEAVWNGFGRYFLKALKQYKTNGLCNNVNTQHDFTYYNVDFYNHSCYCKPFNTTTNQAVDTLINAQDYWGYYNGHYTNPNLNPKVYVYPDNPSVELFKVYQIPSYSGVMLNSDADRSVNPSVIASGSLQKITYASGATTELEYESNEFFDSDVNGNVQGSGIRIKKITNNDGLGTLDVTEYSYNDPVNTSLTTGRALSVPKFAFAFQNTTNYGSITDRVKNSVYLTTYDLNNEPKDIIYGRVTVKRSGVGKSVYEFNTNATFGSTALTDWDESKNYVARTTLSSPTPCTAIAPSFLYQNNAELQYPFASNANYDFERGLLNKVSHYNESNQVVASEEYTYERSHQDPTKIYAAKIDIIGNTTANTMYAYAKYRVNTVVDNFMIKKRSSLYNAGSSTPIVDDETYNFTLKNSTLPYRVLNSMEKQNSDGSTLVSKYKYAKEYTTVGTGGDEMNEAIKEFNNTNNNQVIETIQERIDGGTKTVGAVVNYFKLYTIGWQNNTSKYLPYTSYNFISQTGITNFVPSSINSINGLGVFTKDNNYLSNPAKIDSYSANGLPLLVTDNSRIPKTVLTSMDYGNTVAEFTNAKPANVGFSDFDYETPANFYMGTGSTVQAGGRYSTNCLNFQPGTFLCRSLDKSPTAKNLIVSFWLKYESTGFTNGYISLCVPKFGGTCGGQFTCATGFGVSFGASSQWKYYQFIVPWSTLNPATLAYSLSTSVAVKIDDVMIYPENANVNQYSYTTSSLASNLLTAKTGINGIGNSYTYDNAGRLWLVRDQFDNIIEMKKYKLANRPIQQIPSIHIDYPYETELGSSSTFYAYPPFSWETGDCDAPPILYTWDFGDGSATSTSTNIPNTGGRTTIGHKYLAVGTYQVFVTASSPGMNNVPANTPVVTSTNPLPVKVIAGPPPCYPGTPQICASGIIQRSSTGQCTQTSCTTSPALPNTCFDTYFKLIDIIGGTIGSVSSVEWQIADPGGSNWTNYQTGGFITSYHFHPIHTGSYQMRAIVTFCNNTVAYSNAITVLNGD